MDAFVPGKPPEEMASVAGVRVAHRALPAGEAGESFVYDEQGRVVLWIQPGRGRIETSVYQDL